MLRNEYDRRPRSGERRRGKCYSFCAKVAALLTILSTATTQATWSIVITDRETKEIAIGTVTCLNNFDLLAIVPVVVVGKGAAAVQAAGDFAGIRRPIIFDFLEFGTHPATILNILAGVEGHQARQYGIVDTMGRAVTFSGSENFDWAGGVVGEVGTMVYAIQGNILVGGCVVSMIEQAIIETPGDFADKLMAGMQAAQSQGGDRRCSCPSPDPLRCFCALEPGLKPGHIGGMIVARIGDADDPLCNASGCADGDYLMRLNVAFQDSSAQDPVLQLQELFESWEADQVGVIDAMISEVRFDPETLLADGQSTTELRITPLDRRGGPIAHAVRANSITVVHATDSDQITSIGAVVDNQDGSFSVIIGAATQTGTDRFRITFDDGIRTVILMPDRALSIGCDDGNICTDDSGDPASGCVHTPNAVPCEDGDACTTDDTCSEGVCVAGPLLDCDDGNTCTTDDACINGLCVVGPPLDCSDGNPCTNDSCDQTNGCVNTPNSNPCSSGNACTVDDTCSGGSCMAGSPLNCDDGDDCTADLCDPAAGCVNEPISGCSDVVPTTSTWGLIVFTLLLLMTGKLYFGRRLKTPSSVGDEASSTPRR